MAEFYNGNNKKMMIADSFSSSDKNISYMNNSVIEHSHPLARRSQPSIVNRTSYFVNSFALLIVFCLLFAGKAWGQATVTTVLSENFEHSGSLPSGWSQQWSSPVWQAITNGIGNSSHPSSAHGGSYFVGMYYGDSDCDYNALITPSMNLSAYTRANLKFYLHKEDWGSDADDLTIQYRTSTSGSWTSITSFSSSISSWTLCTVVLPNLSSTYQIRFYGNSCYGYGIYIDDVVVEGITCPSITSLPFLETFNSDSPTRDCWTIVDANSDGQTWNYTTLTDVAGYPYNSNSSANDWLISPKISIVSGSKLTFDYKVASSSYDEKFQVYVMSSPSNYGSATNILGTQTVNNTSWQTISAINLSAYAGQDIHIGIKCISNSDMYNLYIDNFKVSGPPEYAAEWVGEPQIGSSEWCIGETRTVSLQIKNIGTRTWKTAANGADATTTQTDHDLVAVSYHWDEDYGSDGGISYDLHNHRNHFDHDVAPGETATITFDVVGPRMSGTNHLKFAMIRQECCWFYNQNDCSSAPEKVVNITVPALKLDASPSNLCDGGESVLSVNCGLTSEFYEYEPYVWDWNSSSYASGGNIGTPTVRGSVIRFTTTGSDATIDMYNIGSFDPLIYKTFKMRYRVISGVSTEGMQVYHTWAGRTSATDEDQAHYGSLISDGNWHILEMDMVATAHVPSNWTNCGAVLGWRLDPCQGASGITMEIDWVGLFPDPIATDESMLSVSPTQNTTYCACNYLVNGSCIHKATKAVTVATSPTITSSPDIATTCFNSSRQVTLTASGGANVAQPYSYTEGFEGGSMPTDWTQSGSGTWSVGKGDYSESTGAHGGTYNAKITHSSRGYETYLITPELDLSGLSSPVLEFWYINRDWSDDIDALTVYYRVNNGSWTQLFATGYNSHESWTKATVNLTGVAAGYQLGFKMTDDYGYGVSIDDISITGTKYVAPTYSWSSTGTSGSASGATYTVTPRAGSNTYTVSASGCSRTVSIDVLTADNITASGATTDCGTPVTLTASGIDGATYNWYSDAACNTLVQENSSSYTPQNITSSQTYYVKATEDYLGGDLYEYAVRDFGYTGSVQEFAIPEGTEALKLEVWGAQGGNNSVNGGKGGYSVGVLNNLSGISNLYVYVGQQSTSTAGGWNGGGGMSQYGKGGGGATDISLHNYTYNTTNHYNDRIIVAGGGGGAGYSSCYGGYGGGETGGAGTTGTYAGGGGGTQTSGGSCYTNSNAGLFGSASTNSSHNGGGGGGGWYGGGAGEGGSTDSGAGGGSGYVWTSSTASSAPSGYNVSSSYYLTEAQTIAGNTSMPNPNGGTMTGREGNGYARITVYKRSSIPCMSNAKSVTLTVNPLPTPTVTSNSPICEGSQAQLQIQSPNNDYTYRWYSGSNIVETATSYTPTLNSSATYTVNANSTHDQILATYDFDYTGEMQEVVAPANTSYAILEVWGAEGGRSRGNGDWMGNGGKGGYSKGKFATSYGQHFYVVVGGKGHDAVLGTGNIVISAIGGYNGGGGGNCDDDNESGGEASGAGGGATHIAKAVPSGSTNYQLRNYSSNRNDVLIVAGGGGGASWNLNGGAGGGETGGSGTTTGTIIYGGFGYGANAVGMGQDDGVAGGGGGWQGGNTCNASSGGSNAGGGSGYIGGVTEGTTTAGVRSGNGHARIVFYRNGGGSCVSPDRSVTVEVKTKPTNPASIACNSSTTICEGTEITLTANGGSEGTAGCTYQWGTGSNVGSNMISGQTSSSLSITPDANTTYWVRRVANSPCSYTTGGATQAITVKTKPTNPSGILSSSGSTTICNGATITLSADGGIEGTAGCTYQWGTGSNVGSNTISGNGASVIISPSSNTTYWVRRVANSPCSYTTGGATQLITVNSPSVAIPSLSAQTVCSYENFAQLNVTPTSSNGTLSYSWTKDNVGFTNNSATYTPTTAGTYAVTVTSTVGTCIASQNTSATLAMNSPSVAIPSLSAQTVCSYENFAQLNVTPTSSNGTLSYSWTKDNVGFTNNSATYSPTTAGTYAVTVTSTVGTCTAKQNASATLAINSPSVGTLSFTGNQEVCPGTPVTLEIASTSGSVGALSFDWSAGSPTSEATSSSINVTASGEYRVDVTAERTLNGKYCQVSDYRTAIVSYKTPSSSDITAMGGIANGNILWTGRSTDWNGENNWMQYSTAGGGTYTLTGTPADGSNVVVGSYSTCVPSTTLNLDISPSVASIKVGSGITVSGSNAVTLSGDLVNGGTFDAPVVFNGTTALNGNGSTILRDITINSSKTFNAGDKSLAISGNWTNNGTFSSTGTVSFAGGDVQTIGGNAATAFYNVTFDNANGISISKEPTISGTATFSGGIVTGDVTFGASASATVSDYRSYVDGTVTKTLGSSAFTFPTGSNGVLGSVTVPATRAGGSATIRFNKSADAHGYTTDEGYPRWWNINDMCTEDGANRFDHVSNAEYWDITTTATLTNVTFRAVAATDVHFNDTSINEYNPEVIKFALYNGCWKNVEGSASVNGSHSDLSVGNVTISATGRAPYKGTFGSLDENTVLPIELTSFTATCDGRSTLVEWTTATERNNDYFSLERSDDAINFTEIARVAGAGNSIEPIDYAYTDYGIHGGDNYYRLVQVDYDGTRTTSEIIVTNCVETAEGEPDVQAYPNPFNDELTVVLDNFGNRAATIEVYDMLGKLIYTNKIAAPQNTYETILNLSNLPPAAYTVRVSTTDFVINRNVVKQ